MRLLRNFNKLLTTHDKYIHEILRNDLSGYIRDIALKCPPPVN